MCAAVRYQPEVRTLFDASFTSHLTGGSKTAYPGVIGCVVQTSNSGHKLLLPPASWCPIFASRTTQVEWRRCQRRADADASVPLRDRRGAAAAARGRPPAGDLQADGRLPPAARQAVDPPVHPDRAGRGGDDLAVRPHLQGLSPNAMALIASDCDAMYSLRFKWP